MKKLDLATNMVLVNYCMSQLDCEKCCYKSSKYCIIYRYVSRASVFHNNNKIIARAKDFCNNQGSCTTCIYRSYSVWFECEGGSCSTNVLAAKYSEMKGNLVL